MKALSPKIERIKVIKEEKKEEDETIQDNLMKQLNESEIKKK